MTRKPAPRGRRATLALLAVGGVTATSFSTMAPAQAADPSGRPDLVSLLSGYEKLWQSSGKNDLHGTVLSAPVLQHDDELTSWINQHATEKQKFRALQNSAYTSADGGGYDQSMTIADGLGKTLGALYVEGRLSGKLPLTTALINSETGSAGAFVSTSSAKKHFSHPRPYLPADPSSTAPEGDTAACAPSIINSSSLADSRKGMPWADAAGNLKITRVPATTDTTHEFSPGDVHLDPEYGGAGICAGGSFPSGHTTTAYQAGLTLATLLPEVAPSVLARSAEAGDNRIVLGVHYPLDIIGGRMSGEAAIAARWSDETFRTTVLEPARKELVDYLTTSCTAKMHVNSLQACVAADTQYADDPYGGAAIPGMGSETVTDRASAVAAYGTRLSYGFAPTGATTNAPVVPDGAANLLLTTFPTLTDAQRASVLAQTEIASGHPLAVGAGEGWQRLDLAKAMSATVEVAADGSVTVTSTGGEAKVVKATPSPTTTPTTPTTTTSSASPTSSSTSTTSAPTTSTTTTAPAPTGTDTTPAPSASNSTTSGPVVQTDHSDSGLGGRVAIVAAVMALAAGALVLVRRLTH